jgi:integrase
MIAHLKLVEPCNENRQVEPTLRRLPNAEMRKREYLTPAEIEKLIKAAKEGGLRDVCLVIVAYRHGLRAVEAAIWNGARLSLVDRHPCMCAVPRRANRPSIPSAATNCAC